MKTGTHSQKLIALLSVSLLILAWAVPVMATTPRVYQMRGKITAVDVEANTVVINVPIGKKGIFTVAGPLATNAVLKKGGEKVALKDFHKGEWVTVRWQYTKSGHLIRELRAK